jgi:glycerol-3-phosphate dehydrogenase
MIARKPSQVDLAIIGGGINGAGLAALAAKNGLSVVLFEKGDFASGTSSKSTKLIHGGIRYLEHGHFPLVFEALHERHNLLKKAPHLVYPLPFLLPCYQTDHRKPWILRTGLWMYDSLAGLQNIHRHQWLTSQQVIQQFPQINAEQLQGCGLYYDAQTNDARLVLENIFAAEQAGAICMNYCQVLNVETHKTFIEVFYQSQPSQTQSLTASCLVNASGPWSNDLYQMIFKKKQTLVRPTRGSHLIIPKLLDHFAVLITNQQDHRIIFVIPWRNYSLIGTTDLDDSRSPDQVCPSQEEVNYLLHEAGRIFPSLRRTTPPILAAFSGLRPLASSDLYKSTSSISREDRIIQNENILSIVGGKLTTYQSMARKLLFKIFDILNLKHRPWLDTHLPGTPLMPWSEFLKEIPPQWSARYALAQDQIRFLINLYGQQAEKILNLTVENPRTAQPIHPDRPEIFAQILYAVQFEKAKHLDDVLLRRLELGYTPYQWGPMCTSIASYMAELLSWTPQQLQEELKTYRLKLFPFPS